MMKMEVRIRKAYDSIRMGMLREDWEQMFL